jgi:hypothetical protein
MQNQHTKISTVAICPYWVTRMEINKAIPFTVVTKKKIPRSKFNQSLKYL